MGKKKMSYFRIPNKNFLTLHFEVETFEGIFDNINNKCLKF